MVGLAVLPHTQASSSLSLYLPYDCSYDLIDQNGNFLFQATDEGVAKEERQMAYHGNCHVTI